MTEAVPPGIAPPRHAPLAAGAEMRAHSANPEKSGDAKLRDYGARLTTGQRRYVRRTALQNGRNPATQRYGAYGMSRSFRLRYGSPPAGYFASENTAKKGRI